MNLWVCLLIWTLWSICIGCSIAQTFFSKSTVVEGESVNIECAAFLRPDVLPVWRRFLISVEQLRLSKWDEKAGDWINLAIYSVYAEYTNISIRRNGWTFKLNGILNLGRTRAGKQYIDNYNTAVLQLNIHSTEIKDSGMYQCYIGTPISEYNIDIMESLIVLPPATTVFTNLVQTSPSSGYQRNSFNGLTLYLLLLLYLWYSESICL